LIDENSLTKYSFVNRPFFWVFVTVYEENFLK